FNFRVLIIIYTLLPKDLQGHFAQPSSACFFFFCCRELSVLFFLGPMELLLNFIPINFVSFDGMPHYLFLIFLTAHNIIFFTELAALIGSSCNIFALASVPRGLLPPTLPGLLVINHVIIIII
ncbi:hypothetical protein ACJX0J_022756, partial [Zea mays]